MGREMIDTRIIGPEAAAEVLNDPWVYDRITHDDSPASVDEYPADAFYVGGYVNGKLVAVSIVHLFDISEVVGYKFHYQVLPSYRRYARVLLYEALTIILPIFKRLYVEIPTLYPSVINFARKAGFREVSVTRDSFLKNGHIYDRKLMVMK